MLWYFQIIEYYFSINNMKSTVINFIFKEYIMFKAMGETMADE